MRATVMSRVESVSFGHAFHHWGDTSTVAVANHCHRDEASFRVPSTRFHRAAMFLRDHATHSVGDHHPQLTGYAVFLDRGFHDMKLGGGF